MIGNSFDPFDGFHREEVLLGFPGVLLSKLFIGLEVGYMHVDLIRMRRVRALMTKRRPFAAKLPIRK